MPIITKTSPWIRNGADVYYNQGNVGIGTTSPGRLIHIKSGANAASYLRLDTTTSGQGAVIEFYDAGISKQSIGHFTTTNAVQIADGSSNILLHIADTGKIGIKTSSPDRLLHAKESSALTNTVQQVVRLTHITSGVPANGIGIGIEFEQETTADNNEVLATIEAVVTDVTATSEDADMVFKTMAAGAAAAERMRLQSDGALDLPTGGDFQINGASVLNATTLGSAVVASSLTSVGTLTALNMGNDALIKRDVNAGITASTTQSQGQGALTAEVNEISTVANVNDTVTLPAAAAGLRIVILNNGANTLQIFPASGDNLGAGVDTATTLAAGSNVVYQAYNVTNWEVI